MSRILLAILFSLGLMSPCGAQESFLATSHIATWEFIQSVGGIRIGKAARTATGRWTLPVVCDVTGLTAVTHKPTVMNSGLAVTRMLHRVTSNEIHISVVLNTPYGASPTSQCSAIVVSGIDAGEYKILYEEPDKSLHTLGTVRFQ